MTARFDTLRDYRERVVLPALDGRADEFDTEAIANDMTIHQGRFLVEAPGVDFWAVCQRHALEEPITL